MIGQTSNYTQGYSKATVASHASRTVQSDASFLLPYIKPTDQMLDVGCGPGTITVGFAGLVPRGLVYGIDISDQVLDQATVVKSLDNVLFRKADLLAGIPYQDAHFDIVYSSQLFPHLPTADMRLKALTEMRRVLKPGGILATRDAAELHFYPRKYDLDRLWAGNLARGLRNGEADGVLPGGEMPALFRQAGFEKVEVGAGTTVYAGEEMRRWFVEGCLGRLTEGDEFRESWRRVGITDHEVEETRVALKKWGDDEDAWYVALQAEILAWK